MKVYVVQHVHELGENNENIKFIGVYSSEENANAAMSRLRQKPGFRNAPDGFNLDEYDLDQDYWKDGYLE